MLVANSTGVFVRLRLAAATSAVLLTAGLAQPAHAAGGGESFAITDMGRVALTISDGAFDGNTATIPVSFTYEKWNGGDYGDVAISVDGVYARQVGSRFDDDFGGGNHYWGFNTAQKGTGKGNLTIEGSGFVSGQPMLVYGSADFTNMRTGQVQRVAFTPVLTITVAPEQTSLANVQASRTAISGRATVQSSVGTTGADGVINVRYREPGSKRWNRVNDFIKCPDDICRTLDALGNFQLEPLEPIPAGSKVQISLVDCGWCTPVSTTVKVG